MTACFEDLAIGQSASIEKRITDADLEHFAQVSLDRNPLHFDDEFAGKTPFGGRIAHGMLSASLFSGLLGNTLPGHGAIYLAQSLAFKAPVRPGDVVVATVTVTALVPERRQVQLSCIARVGETVVIEGEARLKVPGRK